MLEKCWNIRPEMRPSAAEVQEFVTSYANNLKVALGEDFFSAVE
jgi:hypothetical protein